MSFDVGSDIGSERGDATVDAAADFALGDQRKEALDLIDPGCACGCQVDVPARPLDQPIADQGRLVGGVVVPDEMDLETLGDIGLDLIEELAELDRPMTGVALSDHVAGGDVEGGNNEVVPCRL